MGTAAGTEAAHVRGHFNRQAEAWGKKYEAQGSMLWRAAEFARQLRESVGNAGTVLDFGCGSGEITVACQKAGLRMRGIDVSEQMIERARGRSDGGAIEFRVLESNAPVRLPYADESFDGAIASSVLEYVDDPRGCLRELARVCVGEGALVLTVPNLRHPWRWAEWVLRRVVLPAMFKSGSRWRMHAEYLRLSKNRLRLDEWSKVLKQAGWEVETVNARSEPLLMIVARRRAREAGRSSEVPQLVAAAKI